MTPISEIIINKKTNINPIWIMRQAGRYLPEFRKIRKENSDFIKLCLNENLASEITLQPLKRFDLDAAIIFSDILMLPYGLDQKVEFKKNFGPILGDFKLDEASRLDEIDFVQKIFHLYQRLLPHQSFSLNYELLTSRSNSSFFPNNPLGLKIIKSIISKPTKTKRTPANCWPFAFSNISKANLSVSEIMTQKIIEPNIGPVKLPTPPSIIIAQT